MCRRAVGDSRIQPPVVPVENHASCRTNAAGEAILPNESAWRPDVVLKIIMSRLLAEADKMLDMPVTCLHPVLVLGSSALHSPNGKSGLSLPGSPLNCAVRELVCLHGPADRLLLSGDHVSLGVTLPSGKGWWRVMWHTCAVQARLDASCCNRLFQHISMWLASLRRR